MLMDHLGGVAADRNALEHSQIVCQDVACVEHREVSFGVHSDEDEHTEGYDKCPTTVLPEGANHSRNVLV